MKIAIVGAGIAGLSAAWMLNRDRHQVTLFEAGNYLGGHTNTVDVTLEGVCAPVDTGFLVFNERTYPNLVKMLDELRVASVESDMSFSVRVDGHGVDGDSLEWAGTRLGSLFVQRRNLARPAFWRMLADILRFNRETTAMLDAGAVYEVSLGEYLDAAGYGAPLRDWYLLPMAAAIWSSPRREILEFPLPSFLRFCHNHGLLQLLDRPKWRTVRGGGREYVRRIAQRLPDVRLATPVQRIRRRRHHVEIDTAERNGERFDQVVVACHSNQALGVLSDPSADEQHWLSQVRFQRNRALLHTDSRLMPRARGAWAAWNYRCADDRDGTRPVAVTYWINKLQPLPFTTPVLVTMNPPVEVDPRSVIAEYEYSHPIIDGAAVRAQQALGFLQGSRHTWFAGAWLGHGFHEDGLNAAIAVVEGLRRRATGTREERAAA